MIPKPLPAPDCTSVNDDHVDASVEDAGEPPGVTGRLVIWRAQEWRSVISAGMGFDLRARYARCLQALEQNVGGRPLPVLGTNSVPHSQTVMS